MLLARQGLGKELLRDGLLRTLNAPEIAGPRGVVDAKDEAAKAFDQRYGFEPLRDEPKRLWLMLKDVRGQVGGVSLDPISPFSPATHYDADKPRLV